MKAQIYTKNIKVVPVLVQFGFIQNGDVFEKDGVTSARQLNPLEEALRPVTKKAFALETRLPYENPDGVSIIADIR